MVKADPKHDYYADLNLNSGATTEQIKKAYRELARVYHPDRNRGSEVDVVPKFQAIQAAHEILGDQEARQKYDEQRRRHGYGTARAPTAARPKSYSAYTGVPRKPQTRPEFATRPSTGASRFDNFHPRTSARPKTGARDDAQARADAWTHMHHAKSYEQPKSTPPRPDPAGRSFTSAYEGVNAGRGPFGRSASTRAPKPTGFDPRATQDEPPATGSAYFTSSRFANREVPQVPPNGKTASANPKMTKPADPFAGVRSQYSSEDAPFHEGQDRQRAPYTSQPGEKFNIFGEAIKRSASVRANPGRSQEASSGGGSNDTGEKTPEPRARYRSASPSARRPYTSSPAQPATQPRKRAPAHPSARYPSYSSTSSGESSELDSGDGFGSGTRQPGRSSDPETARRSSESHSEKRKMANPGNFWRRGPKADGGAANPTTPGGPRTGATPTPGQASGEGFIGSKRPMYDHPSLTEAHFPSAFDRSFPSQSLPFVFSPYSVPQGVPFYSSGCGQEEFQDFHSYQDPYDSQEDPLYPSDGEEECRLFHSYEQPQPSQDTCEHSLGAVGEERAAYQADTFPDYPTRTSSMRHGGNGPFQTEQPHEYHAERLRQTRTTFAAGSHSTNHAPWDRSTYNVSQTSKLSSKRAERTWHKVWPFGSLKRAANKVSRNVSTKKSNVPGWAYPSTVLPPQSPAGEGPRPRIPKPSGYTGGQCAGFGYHPSDDVDPMPEDYVSQDFARNRMSALFASQKIHGFPHPDAFLDRPLPDLPVLPSQFQQTANVSQFQVQSDINKTASLDHTSTFQSIFDFFHLSKRASYCPAGSPRFDSSPEINHAENDANDVASNSFNIPSFTPGSQPTETARHTRSEESINTKFSPSDWSGKFQGNPDYFAPPPTAPKLRKETSSARRSPTRGRSASRPSAPATPGQPEMAPMPPPSVPSVPQSPLKTTLNGNLKFPAAPGEQRFKPELWNEPMGWDFRPPEPSEKKPGSPSKGTRSARQERPKAPTVEEVQDESVGGVNVNQARATPIQEDGRRSSRTSSGGASVDAMEIDTEPPFTMPNPTKTPMPPTGISREPSGSSSASPTPARGPRLVSQPTQRPDWNDAKDRTYQAYLNQQSSGTTTPAAPSPRPASSAFPGDQPVPPPPAGPPPSLRSKSAKSSRPAVNLADLKNVAPFASTPGLDGLGDLNTTLPFPSRPSANHPTAPSAPQVLSLPAPPRVPPAPQHLTQASWTQYCERMGAYMNEWSNFDRTMLTHFSSRQSLLASLIGASKGPHNSSWLGQMGDGREGGFESYLRGMKEDERARTHWNVAYERHREAVEGFAGVRGRVAAAFGRAAV